MTATTTMTAARAAAGVDGEPPVDLEAYRRELTGYCYRMLGSLADAEDAVQDALVRAWRHADGLRDAGSRRSWLYRITTRVCFDHLDGRRRRALPVDLSPAPSPPVAASLGAPGSSGTWLEPAPDGRVLGGAPDDPAEVAVGRESVRLALVAALQLLPPRQRAVLVLREVLHWHADEVAALLGTTTASVNSALQRARATLAARDAERASTQPLDEEHRELLERYTDAFERYDMEALVALLHADATMSMPPYSLWLRGPADAAAWMTGPGAACEGSLLRPVRLNGQLGLAQYKPDPAGGHSAWALVVLAVRDGLVVDQVFFLDADRGLFERCGLPSHLPAHLPEQEDRRAAASGA